MEINRYNVNEIVVKCELKPDKDYGQNFLIDPIIANKIVDALDINEKDNVLEVGPGIGSLTHFIEQSAKQYTVVDIDQRMIDFLKIPYQKTNINFICNDIRKVDISNFDKVISNLPYNITTEAISYLIQNGKNITKFVLICQSENYSHFEDIEGKEYGPISVLIHLIGTIKKLFNVKPGSFYPSPKCSSTVFEIKKSNNCKLEDAIDCFNFVKPLFLNRRKTILNNLQNVTKDKEMTLNILEKTNISPTKRPEEIKPVEYEQLYTNYKNLK